MKICSTRSKPTVAPDLRFCEINSLILAKNLVAGNIFPVILRREFHQKPTHGLLHEIGTEVAQRA